MTFEDLLSKFIKQFEAFDGVLLFPREGMTMEEALKEMMEKEGITTFAISQETPKYQTIKEGLTKLGAKESQDYPSLDLGITKAHGAGAETGTLAFVFRGEEDHLLTSLPRVHLAVLEKENLRPHIAQATLPYLKADGPPPYISLVTGPSRTADIELTTVTGVHGPEKLYLMVV